MSYHGDKGGVISIPVKLLSQKEKEEYKNELKYKRVQGRIKVKDPKKQIVRYILLDSFWEHYLSNLDKTILFSCVCNLGENNSSFLKVCTRSKVNVADFFASDDECRAKKIVNCFKEFYPLLMRGNCSSKAAFKPFQDFFFYEGQGYTFNYKRFGGSKIVYYPIAHATGVGNRTNTNKTKTRGSDDTNSSIIVNAQLRYATEESDDILKSIETGICLQDTETKEVTLIPFSNKNIVSNEKKKYGDVTVSNIAVSLHDLIEGKQYAYCCYTKVNGQTTLSSECYRISKTKNYKLTIIFTHDYKKTLYSRDGTGVQYSGTGLEECISIVKRDGEYYIHFHTTSQQSDYNWDRYNAGITSLISLNEYEPIRNTVKSWSCHNQDGVGSISTSVNSDNMIIKCYCDNFNSSMDNSHYDAEISILNIDSDPILSISENHYESHTNKYGLFKYEWEHHYTYVSYERTPIN